MEFKIEVADVNNDVISTWTTSKIIIFKSQHKESAYRRNWKLIKKQLHKQNKKKNEKTFTKYMKKSKRRIKIFKYAYNSHIFETD